MKKSFRVKSYIDSDIKKGDLVRLVDGSGLSCIGENDKSVYIVNSYPKLTGINQPLSQITGVVIKTNIKNYVITGEYDIVYQQDIKVKIGNAFFHTCSRFVCKVDDEPFVTLDGVEYSKSTLRSLIKKATE